MKIITCAMGETWAEEAQLQAMTDEEIIELASEDFYFLLEGARWEFVRAKENNE